MLCQAATLGRRARAVRSRALEDRSDLWEGFKLQEALEWGRLLNFALSIEPQCGVHACAATCSDIP